MKNIRVGDLVYLTHRMNAKGLVTEVFFRPVGHGNGAGPFSKQMFVKFINEKDGTEVVVRRQELRKDG